MRNTVITGVCLALSLGPVPAWAQIAVSSNDHKVTQENGVTKNVVNPPADTITIIDLGALPVKVVGTVDNVPGSVVGPPLSVAITPDESLALVASSSKLDPADPTKLVPDDRVTVIDLKDRKIIGTVKAGAGAAGISITKDGKRAYVANRMAGSISILAIDGKKVSLVKTVPLAHGGGAGQPHRAVARRQDGRGDAQRRRQGRGRQAGRRRDHAKRPRSTWRRDPMRRR